MKVEDEHGSLGVVSKSTVELAVTGPRVVNKIVVEGHAARDRGAGRSNLTS